MMQAPHIEVYYRMPSINSLVMVGVTNGQVNPDDVTNTAVAGRVVQIVQVFMVNLYSIAK